MTFDPINGPGGQLLAHDGEWVDPLCLADKDITLERIATGLANRCRYHGWTLKYYSVAEHCVLLSRAALGAGKEKLARVVLLHDAAEAFFWDIPSPFKRDTRWRELIGRLDWQIEQLQHRIFHRYVGPDYVRQAEMCHLLDEAIRAVEMKALFGVTADGSDSVGDFTLPRIEFMPPEEARAVWCETARAIGLSNADWRYHGADKW